MNLVESFGALLATVILAFGTRATHAIDSNYLDEPQLVERVESLYNNIFVYRDARYYSMKFGHNRRIYTESLLDINDELALPVLYTRALAASIVYSDRHREILMIGLGGGRTSWYLHKHLPDSVVTAVEIDPDVIRLAKKYFSIREESNYKIHATDGRVHLMRNSEHVYDMILVDAYRGPFVPFHLLTKEFYQEVKKDLSPGGAMAQNVEPTTMLFDAAHVTISQVFDNVDVYPAGNNVVIVAYDGDKFTGDQLQARAKSLQQFGDFRYAATEFLENRRRFARDPAAKVLTDDFAPVNTLRAIEKHNRKWESPRD